MPKNQRERVILIVAAICLGLLVLDWGVIEPMLNAWSSNKKAIAALQVKVANAERLERNEKSIRADWNDMRRRGLANNQSAASATVLEALGDWAIDARVNVTTVRSRWAQNDDDNRLDVRVSASGDITAVTRFLYQIEHSSLAVNLEGVEIRSKSDSGQTLDLDAHFTGLVLPQVKASGSSARATEAKKS